MKDQCNAGAKRGSWIATGLLVAALTGMAYCHIKDVGMKFDEHVYYMAYLFCANIAASLALASFAVASRLFGTDTWLRRTSIAAVGLALATIIGFVWSRTAGFPQMDDHIGEWDILGVTSIIFEATVAVIGGALALSLGRRPQASPRAAARKRIAISAAGGAVLLVVVFALLIASASADDGMDEMHYGNMAEYPDLTHASSADLRRARSLHLRTNAYGFRFNTAAKAARLGYRTDPAERARVGCPGLVHFRKGGVWGRVLNPKTPQALVFWCDSTSKLKLVALMYRASRKIHPPTYGGILGWHRHSPAANWMTHIWITHGARAAVATCAPFQALHRSLGIVYESYVQDAPGIDSPCSDTSMAPMS